MNQDYAAYTEEDQSVWKLLYNRQHVNLADKACSEYNTALDDFSSSLTSDRIPSFADLRQQLSDATGWGLEVVPGLIPVDDFFTLLSKRQFCSSTWVRSRAMLDYFEEPDMFHDVFGHTPLLLRQEYAEFMHAFGKLGVRYKGNQEAVVKLQRLYWFTIEFGLMSSADGWKIYGAGIASSYGETNHIFEDKIEVLPLDLEKVMLNPFVNSEIQMRYYTIDQLTDLYALLDDAERLLANQGKVVYS